MYKSPLALIRNFAQLESASGFILLIVTLLALICANTALHPFYNAVFSYSIKLNLNSAGLKISVLDIINHGLMTLFFLVVTLEIKREILDGELSSLKKSLLPLIAALGGMIIPALIFVALNFNKPQYLAGWAIPIATDIAFSLGLISLLKNRVNPSYAIFLTALTIIDDVGAIIIIALFYTRQISLIFLFLSLLSFALLCLINYSNVKSLSTYLILGFVLWVFITLSGIHSSIAGVLIALTIPYTDSINSSISLLKRLENHLHPWVAFLIIPLFAFANAGLRLVDLNMQFISSTLVIGLFLGLFIGKPLGILSFSWLPTKLGLTNLPQSLNWRGMFGIASLCGIGFTMSLFISTLAFPQNNSLICDSVKFSILVASIASSICGYLILARDKSKPDVDTY